MAHIKKMTDKPRTRPWRAHVHRKGYKPLVKMFRTERDAERWSAEQERSIDIAGLPLTIEELKKHTVRDLVRRYLKVRCKRNHGTTEIPQARCLLPVSRCN